MARLDAAARFTPALTKLATDAACEPATTVDEQIVQPAVNDRENAADEALSRFSMISDKSVFSHRKMSIDGASHEALGSLSDTEIDVRNRILAGNFGGKAPSRPEVVRKQEPIVGVRFAKSALFWPPNCFKLAARKQAIGHCFCRIRENPGGTCVTVRHFAACRMQFRADSEPFSAGISHRAFAAL
jgi:hypothetical protein